MASKRVVTAVVAVAMVVVVSACKPVQLEIDFTIRRVGTVTLLSDAGGTKTELVTLSGVVACSGGTTSDSEPIDLFAHFTLPESDYGDGYIECRKVPYIWSESWAVSVPSSVDLTDAAVGVKITACTNPGDFIDEDCTIDQETVTLTRTSP